MEEDSPEEEGSPRSEKAPAHWRNTPPDQDTFRVLISTDNHIGYMEDHEERKNDSHDTFEEILTIAQQSHVDFVLLGGDIFHENKPSRHTMWKTMKTLE